MRCLLLYPCVSHLQCSDVPPLTTCRTTMCQTTSQSITLDVEDLDEEASPEDLMLSYVSGEKSKVGGWQAQACIMGVAEKLAAWVVRALHLGRASNSCT